MKDLKTNTITVLKMRNFRKESLAIGDIVEFQKEPSNEHDKDAIIVLLDGVQIGYVGNSEEKGTVIEGTLSATELGPKNPITGTILSEDSSDGYMTKYLVEVEFEAKKELDKLEFSLIGGISTFPSKIDLLKDVDSGEQSVIIKKEDDNLLGCYNGNPVGRVKAEEDVLRMLSDFIEDSKEVKATATGKSRGNVTCFLNLKSTPIVRKKQDLEKMMDIVITKGINTKTELDEKIAYLLANGVSRDNISEILETYVDYPENVTARIFKPKTLYIDSSGIVSDSIIYINSGKHLIFEGDRGVGKNVLTETLAWLYNRPLYEFSSNSQQSNNSLIGGETFKNKEKNEEKEKSLMGFFSKITSKFFKKVDDKELEAVTDFVTSMGGDNKELVFQLSSILEAFTNGGIIVLDEFNTTQAHVMPLFNALLDDRRRMEATGLGKVEAHPNFFAIGTQNKGYQGTFESNAATVDRFEPIIFPVLQSISKILESRVPNIGYETIDTCNKIYLGIKSSVENGNLGEDVISIRGFISACEAISRGMKVKRALINSVANRANDLDDREAIKNMIDLQIGEE